MHILVNGETKDIPQESSISDLIDFLELRGKRIAIEVNEEIVPASLHTQTILTEKDCVEIVHAIGGG